MSPRSEEFLARAKGRLSGAGKNLEQGEHEIAVGAAYYAMLYAARAALSERDLHAKTHRGTWNRFRQTFAASGPLHPDLVSRAERLAELREDADYEAAAVTQSEARSAIDDAASFLAAVEELLDA